MSEDLINCRPVLRIPLQERPEERVDGRWISGVRRERWDVLSKDVSREHVKITTCEGWLQSA
jgi:hypothetical protein